MKKFLKSLFGVDGLIFLLVAADNIQFFTQVSNPIDQMIFFYQIIST